MSPIKCLDPVVRFILVVAVAGALLAGAAPASRAEQTAFRVTQLELRDPHTFVQIIFFCTDITDIAFNDAVSSALNEDSDADGSLDLNALLIFDPLDQGGAGGTMFVHFGACTPPAGATLCSQDPANPFEAVGYTNGGGGVCLSPIPGTVRPYSPPVAEPTTPCFASEPIDVVLDLAGIAFVLESTQFAATYVGNPATTLTNGLMRGFLDEATADLVILPPDLPFVGGQPLSSILPGGSGNCSSADDRDLGPDGQTLGWWMYLNFEATEVPFTGAAGVADAAVSTPSVITLAPAAPNPFNPATTLSFALPQDGVVRLSIIDPAGRLVRNLVDGARGAGRHTVVWDGRDASGRGVASGVYFARMAGRGGTTTQKLVLSK